MSQAVAALREEEEAFGAIRNAIRDAHFYFTKGIQPVTAAPGSSPLTADQTIQLFDVYLRLILETTDEAAAYVLSRTFQTELFEILLRFLFQPLVFHPTATPSGFSAQQGFLDLRVQSGRVLNHILLRSTSMGADGVAATSFQAVVDVELLPQLLATFGNAGVPEQVRCVLAEAVFIFVLRFGRSHPDGLRLFFTVNGHVAVAGALTVEPCATVRNYCASTMRELVEMVPGEICSPNTLSVCIKALSTDSSADVRVLCAEILSICIRDVEASRFLLLRPHDLLQAVDSQFATDESSVGNSGADTSTATPHRPGANLLAEKGGALAVQEACCRLLQSCCLVAAAALVDDFFDVTSHMQLPSKFAKRGTCPSVSSPDSRWKHAVAVVTTTRFFVQYTPPRFAVGASIVQHFPYLSAILKAAIDAGRLNEHPQLPGGGSKRETVDAFCVEVATSVALLMAQSPSYRHVLQRELVTVPMWATTLKASLTACLNKASLDFFGTVDMMDATGVLLNTLDGVEWSEAEKPRRQSITSVYERQDTRSRGGTGGHPVATPTMTAPVATEREWQRRCRLTFVLLNFAVHLALAPPTPEEEVVGGYTPVAAGASPAMASASRGAALAAGLNQSSVARSSVAGPSPARGGASTSVGRASTPSRVPNFPNTDRQTRQSSVAVPERSALTAPEREALAIAFDKFDSSFQLTQQLAEHFAKKKRDQALYVATEDGFAVRASKLKNPWTGVVSKPSLRSWTVKDIQDGDLFYFAIPFDDLNERSIHIVAEKAKRHMVYLKKAMVTTPNHTKGRRWYLYDALNFIMPKCLQLLAELQQLAHSEGDANLRFPVFLFREKEMHLGERCLHPGNLIEVLDQVKYYFSQRPADLVGGSDEPIVTLKRKLEVLRARGGVHGSPSQQHGGDAAALPMDGFGDHEDLAAAAMISPVDSDDDEFDGYRGHGGISSESEGEV